MCFISLDHQCPGNRRTCEQQFEGVPEFTWRIVAAGDLQEEGKIEKNAGSPQGWEEGKIEGITSPHWKGISYFSERLQSVACL